MATSPPPAPKVKVQVLPYMGPPKDEQPSIKYPIGPDGGMFSPSLRGTSTTPPAPPHYANGGQVGKKPNPPFTPFGKNPGAKPC